jgi:hypothetical protein
MTTCKMARGGRRPGAGRPRGSGSSRRTPAALKKIHWNRHPYSGTTPAKRTVATALPRGAVKPARMRSTPTAVAPASGTRRHHATSYGADEARQGEVTGRPALTVRREARHDLDALWAPKAITDPADDSRLRTPAPDRDPLADAPRSNRGRRSRADPFDDDAA